MSEKTLSNEMYKDFIKRKYNLSDDTLNKLINVYNNSIIYYNDLYINFYWNLRRYFIISEIALILGVAKQTLYNFNVNIKKYDVDKFSIDSGDLKHLNYVRQKIFVLHELLGLIKYE